MFFKKLLSFGLIASLGILMLSLPYASASAQPAFDVAGRRPLVVIRFNQRAVHFERTLHSAVAKAVEAKPEVMFDVVGVTNNNEERLETRLASVVQSMRSMGVPDSRMNVQTAQESGVGADEGADEVRIFVR